MIETVFIWIFGIICGLIVTWHALVLLLSFPLGLLTQRDFNRAIAACEEGIDP